MKFSIIIPVYNEEKTIATIIRKVKDVSYPGSGEIIVVNDGSTDRTLPILQKTPGIILINNKQNKGKGYSVRQGLKKAIGEIILIQDADLEYDPKDHLKLIAPFKDKNTKVVFGSRVLGNNPISHWTFNLGGRFVTLITNLLYGTKITDEPTGYKVFRKNILKNLHLNSKGFEFCPEVTAKIAKAGIKIVEVPIKYRPRPIFEKKIKWYDGLLAIYYLIKYRFFD